MNDMFEVALDDFAKEFTEMFGIVLHVFNVTFAYVLLHVFRRQAYLSPPSALSARPIGQDAGFLSF